MVEIPRKFSVISCVMNRAERAEGAVKNWLECPDIDEIILVDWSSSEQMKFPESKKLKVIRVEGEKHFAIAPALNLAIDHVSGEWIAKMDVDYRITPEFLRSLRLDGETFWRGNNKGMAPDDNERHLNGFVAVASDRIKEVGGYHEGFKGYGHDDCDLYARLTASGLTSHDVREAMGIRHEPHGREMRTLNMPSDDYRTMMLANRSIAEEDPWHKARARIQWEATAAGTFRRSR